MADCIDLTSSSRIGPRLKVWWVPQVPMKPFVVYLNSFAEAKVLLESLAHYDLFQLEHNIKPDFSNAGGLSVWDEDVEADENGERWCDWWGKDGEEFDVLSLDECIELDRDFYNQCLADAAGI